ncbi:MAG: polynucleotide adenylyltransferase PcnB [Acidobacteria bacterium]|nr:polynucleotide adenylyltransferase PcnB [Acidobacteriota bacterium]MBI3264879.1 polynucleotide adenylyltransferase PcnB [Acidobacteriota bacterium]
MGDPIVVPRASHVISRRDVDPDALKVLYRLRDAGFLAYLVGGSVRDLLLRRRPKDFDVGTSAHPYEIKRLFRNCWIIGRRFRLVHVRFGTKVIEVATFRRQLRQPDARAAADTSAAVDRPRDLLISHDNTFGTPEEDAFRRDFTINALFYDIGTFSVIDYVGGLRDLEERVIRSIGDPDERFQEDPVRMIRAIGFAARLGFDVDPPIVDAIKRQRYEIARSAPARLLEEYFKILRAGSAEQTFRMLHEHRLLERMTPELAAGASEALWRSLAALDSYRRRLGSPAAITNPLLLGSLMRPIGLVGEAQFGPRDETSGSLGLLPIPRRDLERMRQMLLLQRRLLEIDRPPRIKRNLLYRPAFADALVWLEMHGGAPEIRAHWQDLMKDHAAAGPDSTPPGLPHHVRPPRRRRRRRPSKN